MKPKLYLFLFFAALVFASCTKWIPDSRESIVGSWRLLSVDRQTSHGTEHVYSGYENGHFYLSSNGNAQYSDSYGQMNGTWRLVDRPADGTTSLELRVYDHYNDDAIEWEFYSIEVSGNRMIAYMYRYGYEYRYEFKR